MSKFGILFDLDGTLINSLPDICGNLNRLRASFGLPPRTTEDLVKHIGRGVEYLILGSIPEVTGQTHESLITKYRDLYLETPCLGGNAYPGVRATLDLLRKNPKVKLGIATNKSTVGARRTLAHYLPEISFDYIAGPEMVSKRKPAPEHLTEVMAKLELKAQNVWFIGDDPVDKECAEAAGVKFFAADYGFGGVKVAEEARRLTTFSDLMGKLGNALEGNAV